MNNDTKFTVAPTLNAPTAAIELVEPHLYTDCGKCEGNIHAGLFFDGTKNNRESDEPKLKHTNVARLFDVYLDKPAKGYFRRYIPGVGTHFPEIREKGESSFGSGFASGCEQRVLFGLLHVFDAIHRSAQDGAHMLTDDQVTALCCNYTVDLMEQRADRFALGRLGLTSGLQMPALYGDGDRVKNLKILANRLHGAVAKGLPHIKECFVDVFGFSRGAAQARVFCSWLDEILTDGKLAGVIIHFRFVGLMDTVASAGFFSSIKAATGVEGGHSGWAEARYLRIPKSVHNCVHMIAGHELRKNFPLDTVTVGGVLPPHCQEFIYPGAQSDVGGGYAPGDLGIVYDQDTHAADAQKLAQIPLNHMLACAIAAGAPMDKERAKAKLSNNDPFAISAIVQKAYDNFVACSTLAPRPVHEWLQPYLNWRWQVRLSYARVHHVGKASKKDRELLIDYNNKLIADAACLDRTARAPSWLEQRMPLRRAMILLDATILLAFDDMARTVLATAKAAPPTDERLCQLFNIFVHDSLAGFDHNNLELSGYWHYRRGFLGTEKRLVVESDAPPDTDKAAA